MKKEHYKLVRDFIPEIIEAEGRKPYVRILDEKEMIECLENKLQEEVNEYFADRFCRRIGRYIRSNICFMQNKRRIAGAA